eukprot:scaffold203746_cov30-Tisochrysis_lutea.AAC.3
MRVDGRVGEGCDAPSVSCSRTHARVHRRIHEGEQWKGERQVGCKEEYQTKLRDLYKVGRKEQAWWS